MKTTIDLDDLKGVEFVRSNDSILICCPYCETRGLSKDEKFNLSISVSKGVYQCWRCKTSGAIGKEFKAQLFTPPTKKHIDVIIEDLLSKCFNNYDFDTTPAVTFDLNEVSMPLFEGSSALRYLDLNRQLDRGTISYYNFRSGTGMYRNRVVIPVTDNQNRCLYFTARLIPELDPLNDRRYLNPSAPKEQIVFNAQNMNSKATIVCEGSFSSIQAGLKGFEALKSIHGYNTIGPYNSSVCIFGSSILWRQALIISGRAEYVYVCLDSDRSRVDKIKISNMFNRLGNKVFLINMPDPKDIGSSEKKLDPDLVSIDTYSGLIHNAEPVGFEEVSEEAVHEFTR